MNPERWKQISESYHSAMERNANDRAAFLDHACHGDEGLRTEINRLLALGEQAERFMEADKRPCKAIGRLGLANRAAGRRSGFKDFRTQRKGGRSPLPVEANLNGGATVGNCPTSPETSARWP